VWVIGPAGEQGAQQAGGGRLADGDAAGDPDHERHLLGGVRRLAEERGGVGVQPLSCRDPQVDQPGQRQVDVDDLLEVHRVVERAQPHHLVEGERQRRGPAQLPPLVTTQLDIRAEVAGLHRHVKKR
jgi:hypothetical protein